MKWIKKGLIFDPRGRFPWMVSHAMHPFAYNLEKSIYRIYFSCRDQNGYSNLAYVVLDLEQPENIIDISESPLLAPGSLGSFDEHGVFGSCIIEKGDELWMYYLGWIASDRAPLFYSSIGLAISTDRGVTFKKYSNSPIMERSPHDPFGVLIPHVIHHKNMWKMWYGSTIEWRKVVDQTISIYNIKYCSSDDGINWKREGDVAIDFINDERNVAHPHILEDIEDYKMWFSRNSGKGYSSGYAVSKDLILWQREDTGVLSNTPDSLDSDSIQHQHIFKHRNKYVMLYNGNDFGRDGILMAESNLG